MRHSQRHARLDRPTHHHSTRHVVITRQLHASPFDWMLLRHSDRVSRKSHMSFTRRPCVRVYLCAWLLFYVGTLHFRFIWVQYSNELSRILHLHKYSWILHKYKHLARPLGVYGCYLLKLFQKRSNYLDKFLCCLVLFFIHRLRDHSTHLCAIFVAT